MKACKGRLLLLSTHNSFRSSAWICVKFAVSVVALVVIVSIDFRFLSVVLKICKLYPSGTYYDVANT
jgi:hypothetical protein